MGVLGTSASRSDRPAYKSKIYKGDRPRLSRTFALTIDNKGNVIPYDYSGPFRTPRIELQPNRTIALYFMSPQSSNFRKIVKALRSKYPNIDEYEVNHIFQPGHMQAAGSRKRTVGYWMSRPEVRLANKMIFESSNSNSKDYE